MISPRSPKAWPYAGISNFRCSVGRQIRWNLPGMRGHPWGGLNKIEQIQNPVFLCILVVKTKWLQYSPLTKFVQSKTKDNVQFSGTLWLSLQAHFPNVNACEVKRLIWVIQKKKDDHKTCSKGATLFIFPHNLYQYCLGLDLQAHDSRQPFLMNLSLVCFVAVNNAVCIHPRSRRLELQSMEPGRWSRQWTAGQHVVQEKSKWYLPTTDLEQWHEADEPRQVQPVVFYDQWQRVLFTSIHQGQHLSPHLLTIQA